jgi:hypothetical protein
MRAETQHEVDKAQRENWNRKQAKNRTFLKYSEGHNKYIVFKLSVDVNSTRV